MKASWSGYVTLGNLAIPMRLYSAIRSSSPRFVRLHAEDHSPVKRTLTCQKENREIPPTETVRAAENAKGKYVEVTESDIQSARQSSKNIIIRQFSDPQTLRSLYYEKPYYMVPGKGGELAYTLLREAFVRANKIAVATFMLYEKEHIGIIEAYEGLLLLQQLRFADEIVPRSDIKTPSLPQPTPEQVDMAIKLMERYSAPFYIEDYRNEQAELLQETIDRKAKGLPPKRQPRAAAHTTPEDKLMPTLHALLDGQASRYLTGNHPET